MTPLSLQCTPPSLETNLKTKENTRVSNHSRDAEPVWSSGVVFYPPSLKYWHIGNQWYDLSNFSHPGGRQILELARDRFEDATFAFEAHHHNYAHARNVLSKYKVPKSRALLELEGLVGSRPQRKCDTTMKAVPSNGHTHFDTALDANKRPVLLGHDAFYSVLRRRVADYLKKVNCKDGGPTQTCVILFWTVFVVWAAAMYTSYRTGSILASVATGLVATWLGGFGHNWIHQPKYKRWAILSLDTVGFSSEAWYREHVLQHHMYTNTPWDNHFTGTAPFLVTDPTVPRHLVQRYIMPYLHPFLLSFATHANYLVHTLQLIQGREVWSFGKLYFILEHYLFWHRWGFWHGVLSQLFVMHAVTSNYYFTLALMNHNAEHTHNIKERNAAKDWGYAQLQSSADWGVHLTFIQAGMYIWLNFHTVHHSKSVRSLLPAVRRTCSRLTILFKLAMMFSVSSR
jgi:hypothetical protein